MVELFGRYCGETSLITAYLAGVDRAIISEVPFDVEQLAELLVADKRANPSNYAMVAISEGATIAGGDMVVSGEEDAYGHRKLGGIGELTGELLSSAPARSIDLPAARLPDALRRPDSLDLMVATNYGSWPPTSRSRARPGGWWRCAAARTPTCRSATPRA